MSYSSDMPLILRAAPNGGWTIERRTGDAFVPDMIGAYSNTRDMLDALDDLLLGTSPEVNRIAAEQGGAA